jgi:hypothetical protein
MQRREFVVVWMRYLLLALLGVVSFVALVKSQDPENKDCIAGKLCGTCKQAGGCFLPQKN